MKNQNKLLSIIVPLLLVCIINSLNSQTCFSINDLELNPVIISQKATELTIDEINECSPPNSDYSIIENHILSSIYYLYKDKEKIKPPLDEAVNICLENHIQGDTLALIYLLFSCYYELNGLFDLALLYNHQAIQVTDNLKAQGFLKSNKGYLFGRDEKNNPFEYPEVFDSRFNLDYHYSILYNLSSHSNIHNKQFDHVRKHIDSINNHYLKILFLIESTSENINTLSPQEIKNYVTQIDALLDTYPIKNIVLEGLRIKLDYLIENSRGQYIKSNDSAKKLMSIYGVRTDNIAENMGTARQKYVQESLSAYTRSLLYLTRTGAGLAPVKEAYNIYLELIKYYNQESDNFNDSNYLLPLNYHALDNILVIGGYLSQQTGDISYIARAHSALDALKSREVRALNYASNRIREGGELGDLLSKNKDLNLQLFIRTEYALDHPDEDLFDELLEMHHKRIALGEEINQLIAKETTIFSEPDITNTISSIQQEVLNDTSAILLLHTGSQYQSMLITTDTILFANLLGRGEQLADFGQWVKQIGEFNDTTELADQSRVMYQRLFAPYEQFLPQRIHIVANGLFETFPFAALRTDSSGAAQYFGASHTLSYHYSLRTLLADQEIETPPKSARKILGLAPDFPTASKYVSRSRTSNHQEFYLSSLLYNGIELDALTDRFKGHFLQNNAATKTTFLDHATDHGIIHLATHAIADPNLGKRSTFFLSADFDDTNAATCRAGEIEQLQLNADLVVLSACETSLGSRLSSEGTVGLTRAFSSAGARSLLSTLWTVDDKTTSEIVVDFYNHLQKGYNKPAALAKAQSNFREYHLGSEKDHPYYWAAFVLVGNEAPINWLGGSISSYWWLALVVSLLITVWLWLKNKNS